MTVLYSDIITLLGAVDFTLNNYKRLPNILLADLLLIYGYVIQNIYLMLFILHKVLIKLPVCAML